MSAYHRGQPNPDLPAIPEGAEEATPVEEAEDTEDTAAEDTLSVAESYANSYAFTLDNVGFDEESLGGSIVGSVAGARLGEASVLHTPPTRTTPERVSRHERRLHRETCRTLGLPYNEDTSVESSPGSRGDGSLGREDSIVGSALGSISESADELDRKRKIDKMWPWPARASSKEGNELEGTVRQSNVSTEVNEEKTKLVRMKEAIASFNDRLEVAHSKVKEGRESPKDKEVSRPPKSKRPRTLKEVLEQMRCVDKQHHRNEGVNPHLSKLTVGATVLFMLLCIIVILATVAVSRQPTHPNLIDDAPEVTTHHDLDELYTSEVEEPPVVVVDDSFTKPAPSPDAAPAANAADSPPGNVVWDYSCLDQEGKFQSRKGRNKKCDWLDEGELTSDRLDDECETSELGLHCRYVCRAYNGCLQTDEKEEAQSAAGVEEGGTDETAVARAPPVPDNDEETPFPTTSTTGAPSKSPVAAPMTGSPTLPTFVDTLGKTRECWWLEKREVRRNRNCILTQVQMVCPLSCAEYISMAVMNSEVHPGLTEVDLGENVNSDGVVPVTSQVLSSHYSVDCLDYEGYYLNEHGFAKPCAWMSGLDPTGELRRIKNCGFPDGVWETTDLGMMCKSTCGTCGL